MRACCTSAQPPGQLPHQAAPPTPGAQPRTCPSGRQADGWADEQQARGTGQRTAPWTPGFSIYKVTTFIYFNFSKPENPGVLNKTS